MPVEQNLSLFRQPLIAQTTQQAIYTKYVTNASKKTPKKPATKNWKQQQQKSRMFLKKPQTNTTTPPNPHQNLII